MRVERSEAALATIEEKINLNGHKINIRRKVYAGSHYKGARCLRSQHDTSIVKAPRGTRSFLSMIKSDIFVF